MQGTESTSETKKSNGSFGSTPEQVFSNSTPNNNAALIGSVNADEKENKNETPASPPGINPGPDFQPTTKTEYAKNAIFAVGNGLANAAKSLTKDPLRTGLTFGTAALLASVGKTMADCVKGDCTMTAEEMQRLLHMTNATLTTTAKAGVVVGVDFLASALTGVGSGLSHFVGQKLFGKTVTAASNNVETETSSLLQNATPA